MRLGLTLQHPPVQQRGVALLTALLITAIIAVIAVNMTSRQQVDIRRSSNILDAGQAYLYALGVESWAQGVLAKDARQSPGLDYLGEGWATLLPPTKVEGGKLTGQIEDLQGRFNLNNLVDVTTGQPSATDVEIFKRLLTGLGVKQNVDLLPDAVIDWIDNNPQLTNFSNDTEDQEYLKRSPPYRTAEAKLASPSELLLIKGFTREVYQVIAPYVTALPETTTVNINTAPAPVLMAMIGSVNLADGESLVKARLTKPKGFTAVNEIFTVLGRQAPPATPAMSLESGYFLVSASSQTGRGQVQLYSVLQRNKQDGTIRVLSRSQGGY